MATASRAAQTVVSSGGPVLPSPRLQKIHDLFVERDIPLWRLKQVSRAIYSGHANFSTLPELPKDVRHLLVEKFERDRISSLSPVRESTSSNDGARKILFACEDGAKIETVGLQFPTHYSLCISSQVGCGFACSFCATGAVGFKRQLTADEIADQVLFFRASGGVDSVSFMGMGEPLANPAVFSALDILTSRKYMEISDRRFNVSTIGIIPGIKKLNDKYPHVNLAYSLHSPFPAERASLMPIQKTFAFEKVFDVLDERIRASNKKLWIAYLLLEGVNDSSTHAKELVRLIKARDRKISYLYHVNLLPYNEIDPADLTKKFKYSDRVFEFQKILTNNNISVSFRNSFGRDIDAACGQLYAQYQAKTLASPRPPV